VQRQDPADSHSSFYVLEPDSTRPKYFTEARVKHQTPVGQLPEINRRLREQHPEWCGRFPAAMVYGDGAYVEVETRAAPADYFGAGGHTIVSAELKAVLEQFPEIRARFFPIPVRQRGEPIQREYFELCLQDEVEAIAEELSRVTRTDYGSLNRVEKLVLDEARIGDQPLFRIRDAVLTVAREDLARAVLDAGCVGAVFVRVDTYTDNWDFQPDVKHRLLQASKRPLKRG